MSTDKKTYTKAQIALIAAFCAVLGIIFVLLLALPKHTGELSPLEFRVLAEHPIIGKSADKLLEDTVRGELCLPWNEVLIAGSAFAGGSNNVEWNRNAMLPFERDHEDPYVFTWTGELGIFSGVVEPGRFKLEGQMTWGPRELHPFTQDEDILGARQMRQGGDDTKWRVSKAGTYRITVNLFHETIEAELLTDAQQSETDGIHSLEAQPSLSERALSPVYYDANGMRLQHPRRGLNLVRTPDGTIRKVLVR